MLVYQHGTPTQSAPFIFKKKLNFMYLQKAGRFILRFEGQKMRISIVINTGLLFRLNESAASNFTQCSGTDIMMKRLLVGKKLR